MQGKTNGYPKATRIFKQHLLICSVQTEQTLFSIRKPNSFDEGSRDRKSRSVIVHLE